MSTKRQTRMGSFILEGFYRIEMENVVREPLWEKSLRKFRLKGNADGNWLWIFWLGLRRRLIKKTVIIVPLFVPTSALVISEGSVKFTCECC